MNREAHCATRAGDQLEYFVGVCLATLAGLSARIIGFDRDRAFYPTVLVVIASYYALFAVMAGTMQGLAAEILFIVLFVALAVAGFLKSLWIVVFALLAHGVFDLFHHELVANEGVPEWWPGFCFAYDVTAAAFLAWIAGRKAA